MIEVAVARAPVLDRDAIEARSPRVPNSCRAALAALKLKYTPPEQVLRP